MAICAVETGIRWLHGQEKSYAGRGREVETIAPIRGGAWLSSAQSLHTEWLPRLPDHQTMPREVEFCIFLGPNERIGSWQADRKKYVRHFTKTLRVLAYFGGQMRPWTYGATSSAGCSFSVWLCTTFACWIFTRRSATNWSCPCCFFVFR